MRSTRPTFRRLRCEQLESRWPLSVEAIVEIESGAPAAIGVADVAPAHDSQSPALHIDIEFARAARGAQPPPLKSDSPVELTATKSVRGSRAVAPGQSNADDPAIGSQNDDAARIPAVAGAPTPTPSALSLDLWPNYNTIGVRIAYTEDPLYAQTTVSANLQVLIGGRWTDAHDFVKDVDQKVLVSKIFGLNEGTSYSIRATFTRRDIVGGVVEQRNISGSTTTQTTPASATGLQVWVAPNGHDRQPGTYEHPFKTIEAAVAAVQPGGSIILKDGEYSFDDDQNDQLIAGKHGAPGQYYTLTAENPGQVRIIGYEVVDGAWSPYGNGIWWIHAPQLANVWGDGSTGGPNHIVDNDTGRLLYPYRSLTADDVAQYVYALTRYSEAGWYYDYATRRLYVKLESRAAPTTGQIRASHKSSGLAFSNSSYWIVDGIHFEQFGRSRKAPGENLYAYYPAHGIMIKSSDHIVVRNSTFRYTTLAVLDSTPASSSNILVENNTFDTDGIWDVFYREPFRPEYWGRIKNSLIEMHAIQATGLGRGMVIRNNTFDGYATSVNLISAHANYVADVDIHQNSSYAHIDDVYEADSYANGQDGGNVNTAIFNNTSQGGLTFVSASSFHRGPLWVINNYAQDYLSPPIKTGQQSSADAFTNSAGWKFIYHNTFTSDAPLADSDNPVWSGNLGHGNLVAKNNIFSGGSQFIFNEPSSLGAHRAPVLFERNAFYTTFAGVKWWSWETASYPTDEAMDAASPMLEMTNNFSSVNPYPSGVFGGLDTRLRDQGAIIRGITSVTATGQPVATDIGRMVKWGFRSQGARVPLASLIRMMLADSGGLIPLSALASVVSTTDP